MALGRSLNALLSESDSARQRKESRLAEVTPMPSFSEGKNLDYADAREGLRKIPLDKLNPSKYQPRQYFDEDSLKELADSIGISRGNIANSIRILNMDPRVIELAQEGKLTEGHCRNLVVIEDPEKQYKAALDIIERGESVRDIERKVKNAKTIDKKDPRLEAIYRDIEDSFQGFFGTKVKLDAKKKSGKIIIQYSSYDDLERILGLIK